MAKERSAAQQLVGDVAPKLAQLTDDVLKTCKHKTVFKETEICRRRCDCA